MKKVVIIDHEPLTLRRMEIFRINELRERGVKLEFWDLSQYFHKGMQLVDTVDASFLVVIKNLEELECRLNALAIKDTIFIVETFNEYRYRAFFRLLSRKRCLMVRMELYATTLKNELSFWGKLKAANIQVIVRAIKFRFENLLNKIYHRYYQIKDYDIYISSGNRPEIDIHINHPDWENARKLKQTEYIPDNQKHVVFCDEYFPLHPDTLYFNKENVEELNKSVIPYREAICNFFEIVEREYHLKVIIAAHPKSDYSPDVFGGRAIYKYKTPELIRNCEFVIFHASTSISYAIIFNKPLLMITTPEYVRLKTNYNYQLSTARFLGLKNYNLQYENPGCPVRISDTLRDVYLYNFLTGKGIEDKDNVDILYDTFSEL